MYRDCAILHDLHGDFPQLAVNIRVDDDGYSCDRPQTRADVIAGGDSENSEEERDHL